MKFTITKENFVTVLKRLNGIISDKLNLPILSTVLIEAEGDTIVVTGSNQETTIVSVAPALVMEGGQTAISYRMLMQLIVELPAGDVTIETIADEQATVVCQRSFFKIHVMSAIDYPRLDDFAEEWSFTMPAMDLIKNISKVSYARSDDENRRILNGILFSVRAGTLTIAATDGRRLALVEKPLESEIQADGDIIMPVKAAETLAHTIDPQADVLIKISHAMVVFQSRETTVYSKLIEGQYPNYRQVIPSSFANQVTLARLPFIDALKRASVVLKDDAQSVKLTMTTNCLTISASCAEVGEASEPLDIDYQGLDMVIAFNPKYFVEPLKLLDSDAVMMKFSDDLSPVELSCDEGFLYILMPMRG